MCGIAGLLLDEINPAGTGWLSDMTQRLFHRGPDDGGAVAFGMNGSPAVARSLGAAGGDPGWTHVPMKLGLGARRLAIVDRSAAGHQPMASPDGRVWVIFNGELYNHAALRDELRGRGMSFSGHADTEVFLAAWRAWGPDCFDRFDGMWAAAIVDWTAGTLVLSRDRFGIKPLYLMRFSHGLAFASEIGALLALPGAVRDINEARLADFLFDGNIDHTDETLFDGIASAPAACRIELDLRARGTAHAGGRAVRYWRPAFAWSAADDAAGRVRTALSAGVASHLQGEAAIGTCLSGGTDSSAIVMLLERLRREQAAGTEFLTQHAFTASLPGTAVDEARYAAAVASACGDLHVHVVTPTGAGLLGELPAIVRRQEQPFGQPGLYLQWEIMRAARAAGVTVLLDGQGGDELFCGYEGFVPPWLAHLLAGGHWARAAAEWRAARRGPFAGRRLAPHVAAALLPDATRAAWRRKMQARRRPWLAPELATAAEGAPWCHNCDITPAPAAEVPADAPIFMRRAWSIFSRESLPSLLRYEDRSSMAFSIEARVPFLSRAMVELALSIPPEAKIKGGVLKAVLRDALRGLVPDGVLDRRDKLGFAVPMADWMRGDLRPWWRDLIASRSFAERGCFVVRAMPRLVERVEAGDAAAALELWRMAIVEEWARAFLDGGASAAPG